MKTENYIEFAIKKLNCSQKDLAKKIGVSPTQISKWKQGEHMSYDTQTKFQKLCEIDDMQGASPEEIILSGSKENAIKWRKLIKEISEITLEMSETGWGCYPLNDEDGFLTLGTLEILNEMGIEIPKEYPSELDISIEGTHETINENKIYQTISAIFESLNSLWGFYAAYIYNDLWDSNLIADESKDYMSMENEFINLAATKIEVDKVFAPNFDQFKHKWIKEYENWLINLKKDFYLKNIPISAEFMDLINCSPSVLEEMAEYSIYNLHNSKIHPDMYLNELLTGQRVIHNILAKIVEKLDIKLDASDFNK